MRILLSNDDGVAAPGLAALRSAALDLGEVIVVAPASPQSAAGHAITVYSALEVRRLEAVSSGGFAAIAVDGRPADCVRLAVRNLLAEPPDLVLSGINLGANVGINVFYSGTVAAAAEAAMLGIPAVAFSTAHEGTPVDWPRSAGLCRWVLARLLETGLTRGDLFNVNIPVLGAAPPGAMPLPAPTGQVRGEGHAPASVGSPGRRTPRGVRFVPQSTAGVVDSYVGAPAEGGAESYQLDPDYRHRPQPDSDVSALAEGFITVTPLHIDMTNHDRLAALAGLNWQPPG